MNNKSQTQTKENKIWSVLGWILFLPAAFGVQAVISLSLGILFIGIGFRNQVFLDSVSAFVGTLFFTVLVGYFAPSKKIRVSEVVFWIISILAVLSFILGLLGVYTFVDMETPHGIIPVLQILGAFYAVVLVPPLTIQGTTYDRLMGKIAGMGGGVTGLGGVVSALGLALGIIVSNWTTLVVGTVILGLGIVTWLIPWIWLYFITVRARKIVEHYEK